ncbi:MAG: hypothetical protein GKR88_07580 [Flavobacteriaceae bacterium]|nr:MAG: hypothetical protein GKR88_07580 [Flavobacteriaceae bacterium]
MKKLLLFIVLLCSISLSFSQEKEKRERNIQAGNPFKEFGYKPKIATLSKGKYLEFHDLDSIVKIGSFTFHVKKKAINGYSQEETKYSEATLRPEIVSRWFSPDPLSDEFPSWSPYNFVKNNPIVYIDPTGLAPEDVIGVTKDDAKKVHQDFNKILADSKFDGVRALLTRGKKNNKKSFDKIDSGALTDALSGLSGDDLAIAEQITGAINSNSVHMVEFAEVGDNLSSGATKGINEMFSKLYTDNGIPVPSNLSSQSRTGKDVKATGGSGLNLPTAKGSHSVILEGTGVSYSVSGRREIDTGHEILGHGLASGRKVSPVVERFHQW